MRVLGPALITNAQQSQLAAGSSLEISRTSVYERAADRARIGDRFWVRESYFEWTPPRHNAPQGLHAVMHGHRPVGLTIPRAIKPYFQRGRLRQRDGARLTRRDSRASLEITEELTAAAGWRCRVHMGNIDGRESEAA